jgi:hypothetical protein
MMEGSTLPEGDGTVKDSKALQPGEAASAARPQSEV